MLAPQKRKDRDMDRYKEEKRQVDYIKRHSYYSLKIQAHKCKP